MNTRQQYQLLLSYVGSKNYTQVDQLLKKGVSPNTDEDLISCLHLAVNNQDLEMIKLLAPNADLSRKNKEDKTALDVACENGSWGIVEFLLVADQGRHINIPQQALRAAIKAQQVGIVKSLLERGVSPNSKEDKAESCLHLAVAPGELTIPVYKAIQACKEIVRLLLVHHADLTKLNKEDFTPIRNATTEMAKYIASIQYADSQDDAKYGVKMLDIISQEKIDFEAVKALLFSGARADSFYTVFNKKPANKSALHYAVEKINIELIHLLRVFGADAEFKDANNKTPSDLAHDIGLKRKDWRAATAVNEPKVNGKQLYDFLVEGKTPVGIEMPALKEFGDYYKEAVFVQMIRLPEDKRQEVFEKAFAPSTKLYEFFRQHRGFFSGVAGVFSSTADVSSGVLGQVKQELDRLRSIEEEKISKNKLLDLQGSDEADHDEKDTAEKVLGL